MTEEEARDQPRARAGARKAIVARPSARLPERVGHAGGDFLAEADRISRWLETGKIT